MLKLSSLLIPLLFASNGYAANYTVWQTQIKVYAQSREGSTAHMIESVNGIYGNGDHPWCARRAYLDFSDKEIFSVAIAASASKQKVNFIYEDAAMGKTITGHEGDLKCKVISIFY